jgi:hypothetical protein
MAECTFSRGEVRLKENTEMMPRLAGIALILFLASTAYAQQPTPLEIAVMTCIAPGFIPDSDPFDLIASLPEKHCIRACRASAKGCKDLAKTIDRCGVSFLKAAVKTSIEICRGLGGTAPQCGAIKGIAKPDIDWWRAEGKLEKAACDADMQTLCLSRCQPAATAASYNELIPASFSETSQGGAGGAIEYLQVPDRLSPIQIPESPQGGAGVTETLTLHGVRVTAPPLVPEPPEEDVRQQAEGARYFLE